MSEKTYNGFTVKCLSDIYDKIMDDSDSHFGAIEAVASAACSNGNPAFEECQDVIQRLLQTLNGRRQPIISEAWEKLLLEKFNLERVEDIYPHFKAKK